MAQFPRNFGRSRQRENFVNINDAKQLFIENYVDMGLKLVEEKDNEIIFGIDANYWVVAGRDELEAFAAFEEQRADFATLPNDCSMCSNIYREQVISNDRKMAGYLSLPSREGSIFTFGAANTDQPHCVIGRATQAFVNYFRFEGGYKEHSHERLRLKSSRTRPNRRDNTQDLSDLLFDPITIQVRNINASSQEEAVRKSNSLIDSCLFTLAYTRGTTFSADETWPSRRLQARARPFHFGDRTIETDYPFPVGKLISDIVKYYHRGMASSDPVIAFLSFYQVLEYFFVSVSDEQLYTKLTRRLSDPKFRLRPKNLDKIINDTLSHKRESDETEMLKQVLGKFVEPDELIQFIKKYEDHLGAPALTKKRKIFGEESEVRLNGGHVIGNVSSRIKGIRNALVHSSDRYNRQDVFVPTAANEEIVSKEIPLVQFLAEKVIICSAIHTE